MSYQDAERCFQENCLSIRDTNPVMWNLNSGLIALTRALQSDLSEIQHALSQLAQSVERCK